MAAASSLHSLMGWHARRMEGAIALWTVIKKFSCVYFKRTNNSEQSLEFRISAAHFHIDDGAHISIALVGYFFLCEAEL